MATFFSPLLKGVTVNSVGGTSQATFDANGFADIAVSDTSLVSALTAQGASRVDYEGTEEALTADTVQTALTCSALSLRNGAGSTVLEVYNEDADGDLLFGPITIAANAERVIVFPTPLAAPDGVFVTEVSGGLDGTTPGFLIP